MAAAKKSMSKIIQLIFTRKYKIKLIVEELKKEVKDDALIRQTYVDILKISSSISYLIDEMQHEEPLLKREFVFNDIRYDDRSGYMYCQIKSMRRKVLEVLDCVEADYILLPTGEIGPAHKDPSLEDEYVSDDGKKRRNSSTLGSSPR